MIKSVVFDLDGTLMESHETIYKTAVRTFEELGIEAVMPKDDFYKKIGHHFRDIFRDFNIHVPDLEYYILKYKGYYREYLDDTRLYPHVPEVLKYLKDNGYFVSLLTTKAQDQAELLIEHFDLLEFFDLVRGRVPQIPHKPAPDMLLKISEALEVDTDKTLMVGDSELDIRCGKNAGAKTCAVTFGYRDESFLRDEYPDYIISDMQQLISIL